MSSGYWQTKRQTEQFGVGGTLTQKIEDYTKTWESRCYSGGIPDEVPEKLAKTGRVPNYKSIAMCILRNDLQLRALGFGRVDSVLVEELYQIRRDEESQQLKLL
jgi:predicted phosphoadenosine phosphosulfate sulfurtransferase